ncbi:trace amine-associated receptor 13c-like [Kryptolebias marmoratus]|uniref:trace amine-associated receptor 13c-like n=1 Tax=Kryptolebias marmoratus TaxID=37003 RepID=UPI0018ACB0CC|nr:trace amine-associated receptor 13c-like [Kryptolebias marmoratus]
MEETELCFPQLFNSSCSRLKLPYIEVMLYYIVLSSISVLTALLNLLVIISISHFRLLHNILTQFTLLFLITDIKSTFLLFSVFHRQLQTPTNLLLLSLAVSDFFVGLLLVFQILLIDGCWILGDIVCSLYQYLSFVILSASLGTLVLISIDRYVAICYPLHYSTKITQDRVKICICVFWICLSIFQSLILKDSLKQPGKYNSCIGECVIAISYIAGIADMIVSFIAPITVIVILYLRVFMVVVSQTRAMRSQVATLALHSSVKARKSQIKAAKTLGVVVVVFLLCMLPYYCVALTGEDDSHSTSSATFEVFLFYFNSCLNPIIYVFFYPWFRKSIKLIVTLQIVQTDSCKASIL